MLRLGLELKMDWHLVTRSVRRHLFSEFDVRNGDLCVFVVTSPELVDAHVLG